MTSLHLWRMPLRLWTEASDGWGLLALRLWLGQEFAWAGYTKLASGPHAPAWFAALDFPFGVAALPVDVNWVLAGATELLCAVALVLGWQARIAALALLFVSHVAIYTVHFDLGWAGWREIETEAGLGFKVPLMMGIMLLTVLTQGAGRWSVDRHRMASARS